MSRSTYGLLTLALVACATSPQARASEVENPMFHYTHLLPSPFTLGAGQVVLGTGLALGITDFLQVGTDLVSNLVGVYNANAKVSLIDREEFALALTGSYLTYNYRRLDDRAPDLQVTSWLPGVVTSIALAPLVSLSVGGNLNFTSQELRTEGVPVSGYYRGATVETDVAWMYYQGKKGNRNAVAGGISYDFNYKLIGVGLSHYFKAFKLGVHYYPGSDEHKFHPIIEGGTVISF